MSVQWKVGLLLAWSSPTKGKGKGANRIPDRNFPFSCLTYPFLHRSLPVAIGRWPRGHRAVVTWPSGGGHMAIGRWSLAKLGKKSGKCSCGIAFWYSRTKRYGRNLWVFLNLRHLYCFQWMTIGWMLLGISRTAAPGWCHSRHFTFSLRPASFRKSTP